MFFFNKIASSKVKIIIILTIIVMAEYDFHRKKSN